MYVETCENTQMVCSNLRWLYTDDDSLSTFQSKVISSLIAWWQKNDDLWGCVWFLYLLWYAKCLKWILMELFDAVCLVMTMSSNRRVSKYVISTKAESPFNWNCWLSTLFSLFPSHHNGLMWHWKTSLPTETSELMEQSVLDKPIINQQVKFPVFLEPKCSFLCSQNPITGPCPEPDESCLTTPPHIFKIHFLQNVKYFKTRLVHTQTIMQSDTLGLNVFLQEVYQRSITSRLDSWN